MYAVNLPDVHTLQQKLRLGNRGRSVWIAEIPIRCSAQIHVSVVSTAPAILNDIKVTRFKIKGQARSNVCSKFRLPCKLRRYVD